MPRRARAALHGQSGWLVNHQDVVILVKRDGFEELARFTSGRKPA